MLSKLLSFCMFAFYFANFMCWTVAKYILVQINVQQENHESVDGNSANGFDEWKDLEYNDVISLSHPRGVRFKPVRFPASSPC